MDRRPYGRCWAGFDGCRAGWVVALVRECSAAPAVPTTVSSPGPRTGAPSGTPAVAVSGTVTTTATFAEAMAIARGAGALAVGVDMPIGLSEDGRRHADRAARSLLGSRRATVFPTPVRATLDAVDYPDALAISRRVSGVGLSKQAWNLLPRIAEVDRWIDASHEDLIFEVHPELAFARLAGEVLTEPKKTPQGLERRAALLTEAGPFDPGAVDACIAGRARPGVQPDDVLDALAVALSTRCLHAGTGTILGDGARDRRGLLMRICF